VDTRKEKGSQKKGREEKLSRGKKQAGKKEFNRRKEVPKTRVVKKPQHGQGEREGNRDKKEKKGVSLSHKCAGKGGGTSLLDRRQPRHGEGTPRLEKRWRRI